MKLTVLTENIAGGHFFAEHGLSYLIEHDGKFLLFDTGHSDIFKKNAIKMGYNLNSLIDTIILSHGHWDHGDGLSYLQNKRLITHPSSFIKRYRRMDKSRVGLAMSYNEIKTNFELVESKQPYKITDNILFLGEIPRINDFESKKTTFIDAEGNPDFVPDDSALAVNNNGKLIVITGCSHSGICNIVDYAIKTTGLSKVQAVIGGFHLKKDDELTKKTVNYLKSIGVENVYPSHCTELPALSVFFKYFKINALKTGNIINL